MDGGATEVQPRRDLLFRVALEKTGKCLPKSGGKLLGIGFGFTHERTSDHGTDLCVEEIQNLLLAIREVAVSGTPVEMDVVDAAAFLGFVYRRESRPDLCSPEVVDEYAGSVVSAVRDGLYAGQGHEPPRCGMNGSY
jgi:hypothetical protein